MSEWASKRFWKDTAVTEDGGAFTVLLDGRGVRTPGKSPLLLPTRGMAEAVAAEFEAQDGVIDPNSMPWTRSANSAIEKVAPQRAEVEGHLIGYAETDLLSYRADGPAGLVERQVTGWDPVLDWLDAEFGARLAVTSGVMPTQQDPVAISRLAAILPPMSDFALTGFYDLVTLTGSFGLAVAVARKRLEPDAAWELSRLDETWQIEQWGDDEEAADVARIKRDALLHAADFFSKA